MLGTCPGLFALQSMRLALMVDLGMAGQTYSASDMDGK